MGCGASIEIISDNDLNKCFEIDEEFRDSIDLKKEREKEIVVFNTIFKFMKI